MARIRITATAANTVPTPPAGKATMFVDSADLSFKAKLPDGSLIPISATPEYIQDVFANFIQDSATINFTYDDVGNVATLEVIQSALDIFQIPVTPTGNLTATNVGAALNELQSDIDTRALNSDLQNHINDTVDAHDASAISFDNTDTDQVTSTEVQGAIEELDKYLTDNDALIRATPGMGVITGGFLQDGGGFTVNIGAGFGYLQSSPYPNYQNKRIDWNNTSITLGAHQDMYIFFNSSGILSASAGIGNTTTIILLGRVVTNSTGIVLIEQSPLLARNAVNFINRTLREGFGSIYNSGSIVTENVIPFKLNITSGIYFYSFNRFTPSGGNALTFTQYYRDGLGDFTKVISDTINNTHYDNGTGILQPLTTGYYTAHTVYINSDDADEKYFIVYGQNEYSALAAIESSPLPTPPPWLRDAVTPIARIVVEEGASNIAQIYDIRPSVSFKSSGVSASADHGNLLGLEEDDHEQYLLVNGNRPMADDLNMGGNDINNVATVDGRDISVDGAKLDTIETGATADQIASEVPFTPVGTISATNVQAALAEVDSEKVPNTREVNAGTGLSGGGDLSANRTISMPNVGTPSTYGSASSVPVFTTDAQGRVSGVVSTAISIASSAVTNFAVTVLSTVLTGYTVGANTALAATDTILQAFGKIQGQISALFARQINAGSGLTGGGDLTADRTISMPNVGTPGSKGSASEVPVFTTDAQGRVSASTNTPISGVPAANIVNTPAGNIAATNVQAALNELDAEKQPLDGDLTAVAALAGTGLVTRTAANTMTTRTITGTPGDIDVSNGDGVSGNPTLALPNVGTASTVGAADSTISITTDAKGRITSKSSQVISIVSSQVSNFAATVRSTVLTGLVGGVNTAILATDTLLTALQNLQAQITNLISVKADKTTTISTGYGLTGGGDLSTNRTFAVSLTDDEVSASNTITTTSGADVLMTGMTLTPAAGTYLVLFSACLSGANNDATITTSIYAGGVSQSGSERDVVANVNASFGNPNTTTINSTSFTVVVVNGSQAIEGRWRRAAGTATATKRHIKIVRIG